MLETCLNCLFLHLISLQADLTRRAAEVSELRNRLAATETASAKAKDELVPNLTNTEKLKKDLKRSGQPGRCRGMLLKKEQRMSKRPLTR